MLYALIFVTMGAVHNGRVDTSYDIADYNLTYSDCTSEQLDGISQLQNTSKHAYVCEPQASLKWFHPKH